HRVASEKRERGIPAPHGDREVEGADQGHRPERVPRLREAVTRTLRGDRLPVELARQPDREVADVDHLLDLPEALLRDLPALEGDERAERLLLAAQLLAEQPDELPAAGARSVAAQPDAPRAAGGGRVAPGL